MKEGWSYKKLGEVCDFEGGSQPPKSEWINHPQDGYVRMLQIRDFTRSRNAEIEYVKISKKIRLCKADDILIGRYGASVGKILTGLAGAYNVAIIKSIPNEELISKAFIKRYFEARSFQSVLFKVCASRAAQAGFSKDDICDTPIPVPPLSEQHSIVSRLDSAFSHIDALKANAEKQLNEARKLFQAELTECMKPKEGWEEKKLGEVCDFEGGSQPPKSEWINHPQDGYVRMLQIRDFTRSRNAEIEYVKISKKIRLCKADDILIGRYGASVGKILTGLAGAYNVAIIKSIPNEELISKAFIKRYFEARSFQSVLFKVCASRAAQAGFSKDDICDTPIPVPPLSEQYRIVSHLDSLSSTIRKLEELQQKTIAECDALKQAMLREVFE